MKGREQELFKKSLKAPARAEAAILSVHVPPLYEFTANGKESIEQQIFRYVEKSTGHEAGAEDLAAIAYVAYKCGFANGHKSTVDGSFAAYQEFVRLAIEEPGEE